MNEIAQDLKLNNPSITLYAFHLRNSLNDGLEPTVAEAPQLWEQLVEFGNKLHIPELRNLQQQLICYQDNKYFPQAEDLLSIEYLILLRDRKKYLNFQLSCQANALELLGMLCPIRLHDSYAIDLTLFSQDTFTLAQLSAFNFPNLLLPLRIQASLGQTLLLFGQPTEPQEDYQSLADAYVAEILLDNSSVELVGTGYLLGNPFFEYESAHTDPAQKLHVLVWFQCQDMNPKDMDKVAEILLYILWCHHKIQYVYHQSRWCNQQAQKLYGRLEEFSQSFSQIPQTVNQQLRLKQLLAEIRQTELQYDRYLGEMEAHKTTIFTNAKNYQTKLEKLETLPETKLVLWQQFLHHINFKLLGQIQIDLDSLKQGRDRLQPLKDIIKESVTTETVSSDMSGLPPEIHTRLTKALLKCEQFDNAERLRNFFKANDRLTPWEDIWKPASPAELVEKAIGVLNTSFRDTGENVLVILVRSLANSIDPGDTRHQTLAELAEKLDVVLPPTINTGRQNPIPNQSKRNQKCSFNWLHLTDLHQGMGSQDWLWPSVREIFFKDLERLHDKCGPWDLVLFTGDLTQRGSAQEFQNLDKLMDDLWAHFHILGSSPKLLAIPGNHDLVRPDENDPAVILLQQWQNQPKVQQAFWADAASPYRQVVTKAFENYSEWWERQPFKLENLNQGILPGDFSATFEKEGAKLGIVGLNTSFLQLTGGNYKRKLALHSRQFHKVCNSDGPAWAKQHHACLFLTHHPPEWLNEDAEKDLKEHITAHGRFAVHLCGHLHEAFSGESIEGGADARRIWQSRSLFGLEYHSSDTTAIERLHGYTAAKIEVSANKGNLIFWPRKDFLQGGQRNIVPDPSCVLIDDKHTRPTEFDLLQPYIRKNI